MGEREKLLLADDMGIVHNSLRKPLIRAGHEIVADAYSFADVQKIIDAGTDFTVALVDGKMPRDGDGEKVANYIRTNRNQAKIISLSSSAQTFGDINLRKDSSLEEILAAIKSL